jgi:glucose-1-phosphatase
MKINPRNFKNIIFDFGGVIINLDYTLTAKAFAALGLANFDALYSKAIQNNLFDDLEQGALTPTELRNELRKNISTEVSDAEIDHAWNAMLLDLPKERLELLSQFKQTHNTFLLSNTNEIHINCFHNIIKETVGKPNLESFFHKVYYSSAIGMRKPHVDIFEFVLNENNLLASETLFIDDSIQHIEGAKKAGLHTYWLDVSKESILDILA